MTPRADVIVVGSINIDFVVALDSLPRPGETVSGGVFARHFGGKGANQAVAAARLGASVRLIGAVGDDDLGRTALADLAAEGIGASGVAVLPGVATGVALIVVDRDGDNQIAVASGANAALSAQLVERALSDAEPAVGSVVVVGFEAADDAVLAAAAFAGRYGLRIIVNAAPARPLASGLADAHPILVANELEAASLARKEEPAPAAVELATLTGAPAIVTLGKAGAMVAETGAASAIAAPKVRVLDTTGAGDAFVGALATELAHGATVLEAARFAVAAASLSVAGAGARGGMPGRAAVEALIAVQS